MRGRFAERMAAAQVPQARNWSDLALADGQEAVHPKGSVATGRTRDVPSRSSEGPPPGGPVVQRASVSTMSVAGERSS